MENERLEKLRKEEEMEAKRKLAEERKLAKKKAEKEKAKDKKKAEQAAAAKKVVANGKAPVAQKVVAPKVSKKEKKQQKLKESPGWSLLGWLNMLLLLGLVGAVASGVYLYTDGDLSGGSLEEAYTKLINNSNKLYEITVEAFQPENLKSTAEAVSTNVVGALTSAWSTLQVYTGDLNIYIEPVVERLTPAVVWLKEMIILCYNWLCESVDWDALLEMIKSAWRFLQEKYVNLCEELNKNEAFMSVIDTMRTHAASVLEFLSILWASICKQLAVVMDYVQEEGPVILATVKEQAAGALHAAKQSLEGLVK